MAEKILLVEDDRIARNSLCLLLREEGYQVEPAADGAEASKLLEEDTFDLVLSDLFMPEIDGYQLLDRVRSRFAHIRTILMTGNFILAGSTLSSGADAYILKPFSLEELLQKIRAVLDENKPYSQFENGPFGEPKRRPARSS